MSKNSLSERIAAFTPEQRRLLEERLKKEGLDMAKLDKSLFQQENQGIRPIVHKDGYPAGCFPVSIAQKRMYTLSQLEGSGTSYNMPGVIIIDGVLRQEQVASVFYGLIKRHETLRTSFEMVAGELVQRVHPDLNFQIISYQASDRATDLIIKEFIRPFDLHQPPLLRVGLVDLAENRHLLIYDMHHIISDGISMGVLEQEFVKLYEDQDLPPLRIQYKDYADWQNEWLQSENLRSQEKHWLDLYGEGVPVLNFPTDYPRPGYMDFRGENYHFELNRELTWQLKELANQKSASVFMVLLAGYSMVLSRFVSQDDMIIGIPVSGRNQTGLEQIIGVFLNTLAIRLKPRSNLTFNEFLGEVRTAILQGYQNQDYPFELLLEKLQLQRDLSRTPLFDTLFNYTNMNQGQALQEESRNSLKFSTYPFENPTTKFDITVDAGETNAQIIFNCTYRTSLFKRTTLVYLMEQYLKLLQEVVANPNLRLPEYGIFSRKYLPAQNLTIQPSIVHTEFEKVASEQLIVTRFEEQVLRYPEHIALKSGKKELTYMALNQAANRVGHMLAGEMKELLQQSPPLIAPRVALLFEHDCDMVIGILGVLKSGMTYVPLDPGYPEARLMAILEDADLEWIVTNQQNLEQAEILSEQSKKRIINIDMLSGLSDQNLHLHIPTDRVAYIMYTSGSTGKPKGVMQDHRNIMHFIRIYTNLLHICSHDRIALFTSYSHTVGGIDIFSALLNGATLCLYDLKTEGSMERLSQWMQDREITIYHSVPTVYRYWVDAMTGTEEFRSLRAIVLGGEAVYRKDAELYREHFADHCLLVNLFGSSEVIIATAYVMDRTSEIGGITVPVGYPVEGVEMVFLNENHEEAGVYGIGEIVYESDYLAPGYWRQPEKTREVFTDSTTYRRFSSGDLGRVLPDGRIEYLGRKDFQIKIRGYRIELGEIESILNNIEGIKRSVVGVFTRENSYECYMVAYYETYGGIQVDVDYMKETLEEQLPDSMIPSYFVFMQALPETPNGKLDRKALPEPDESSGGRGQYEAPRDEVEMRLARIWQDLLGKEHIGIHDHFFDLGGHSLKATNLISRLHKEFRVEVPLKEIFRAPVLQEMAKYIKIAKQFHYAAIPAVEKKEYYPLSSPQKRMYILNQLKVSLTSYNTPGVTLIEGKLQMERLEKAFLQLIQRHESLRTSFVVNGEPMQKVNDTVDFKIAFWEKEETEVAKVIEGFVQPFDLEKAPLFRVGMVKLAEERHVLLCDLHHIITDGTSMNILIRDFISLYYDESLPPLRIQYKDYAVWENQRAQTDVFQKQEEYWLKLFTPPSEIPVLNIPTDYPRPEAKSFAGGMFEVNVGPELTLQLQELSAQTGTTLYMILLAVFNILLAKYSGQEDLVIGSPVAGRPHADLENMIGMFVNTLAMRNYPGKEKSFLEFLTEVKQNALDAFENQDYPFDLLVEKLALQRELNRNPLFDVMFNLQNTNRYLTSPTDLQFKPFPWENKQTKFDLTLTVILEAQTLCLIFEYCTEIFTLSTMQRMADDYITILGTIVATPDIRLQEITLGYQYTLRQQVMSRVQFDL